MSETRATAARCRHYAMCKIDYLGTGLCPAGREKHYVAYYPQGRMDLYEALDRERIPVTERLVDIVHTCTLCGICDKQCHFYTGLRPMTVMAALQERVREHLEKGMPIWRNDHDPILGELQAIVGEAMIRSSPRV